MTRVDDELHGWGPALEEIRRRKAEAHAMGGEARLDRQHDRGRLNARERLGHLFDPGTFFEIGTLVGTVEEPPGPRRRTGGRLRPDQRPTGTGRGRGRDRPRWLDRERSSDKRYRLCQLARQERVPLVMMLEGAGHRVTETASGRRPGDLMGLAELSGVVPMVAWCSGHRPVTAHSPRRCATSWP